jgi:hypothetical protein
MIRRARFPIAAIAIIATIYGFALPTFGADAPARKQQERERATVSESNVWYALRLTRGDMGVFVTHLWSNGRRMRAEMVISGVPIQQIVNGEWYYVIDVLRGTGIAVRRSAAAQKFDRSQPGARPFGNEAADLIERGAEVVREESVSGRKARVFRLTDEQGRHEVWVMDDDSALPVRIDSTDRNSGSQVVTDYIDWLSGFPVPSQFFEPGAQVQLERVEYEEYIERASRERLGPAPVLFGDLLHGRTPR